MALDSSDVYSPANPGLAQVLGNGLGPLRELQQENFRRQREAAAAARLKQQQEKTDASTLSFAGDTKGWLPHNEELAALKKTAYGKMMAIGVDPSLSPIEKKAKQQETWDEVISTADKSRQLQKAYTERLALAGDKRYNKQTLEKSLYDAAFVTDEMGNKRPKTVAESDASMFDAVTGNRATYNEDEVLKQFIKAESDKENERIGKAAHPGGYGVTNAFSSDIFASKDGKQLFNADGSPAIRDINALIQRAHSDPFVANILRDNAQKRETSAGASAMANYAQLTPEQNAALSGIRPAGTAERVDLADLVTKYGKVKSSSIQTYKNPLRPAAGAGAKTAQIEEADGAFQAPGTYNATVEGSTSGIAVQPGNTKVDIQNTRPGTTSEGFPHYGKGAAPKLKKKDGTYVDVEAKNLLANGFYQEDGQGHFTYVPNNKTPLAGGYGEPFKMLVDSRTQRLRQLAPGESAEKLIREGKAEYATHLNMYAHKNENYTADLSKLTDELLQEKNSNDEPKYQSRARAEIVAREALEKGRSRKLLPYNENAVTVDNDTRTGKGRGYYKAFEQSIQAENARIRASAPSSPGGGIYKRPAAAQSTKTATPSRGGSIYKTK